MPLKYGEHWVTLSNGSRVLLDKDGQVVAGFRAFIGKNISECGPSVLQLQKYVGIKKTFSKCLSDAKGKANEKYFKAAKDFFDNNLKNTFVETALNNGKKIDIHFTGKTWNKFKMDMNIDPMKAKLVQYVPDVLKPKNHYKSQQKTKYRNDFDQFHYFQARLTVKGMDGKTKRIRLKIDVGERTNSVEDYEAYHMHFDSKKNQGLALDVCQREAFFLPCRTEQPSAHTQDGGVSNGNSNTFAKPDNEYIPKFFEVVKLEYEDLDKIIRNSDQAALDHFCRRIAALGMDVFSVSKGAGYAEEQYKRLLEENGNGTK